MAAQQLAGVPSKQESRGNPNHTRHPAALTAKHLPSPPVQLGITSTAGRGRPGEAAPPSRSGLRAPRRASCSLPAAPLDWKQSGGQASSCPSRCTLANSLKAAAWFLLQWEAPEQGGEKEKGQVPLLTPSRILASPAPAPSPASETPPKPCHPKKACPRHCLQGMPCPLPPGRRSAAGWSRAGAGKASPAASGCNQCLQNWLRSFPASSQLSCFPQDPEPITPCAGVSHVHYSELHPWSSAWLPALPTPRGPALAENRDPAPEGK